MENLNLKNYVKLLKKALNRFYFKNFEEILDTKSGIVWRHDVERVVSKCQS